MYVQNFVTKVAVFESKLPIFSPIFWGEKKIFLNLSIGP
jgi:hypothetical protein